MLGSSMSKYHRNNSTSISQGRRHSPSISNARAEACLLASLTWKFTQDCSTWPMSYCGSGTNAPSFNVSFIMNVMPSNVGSNKTLAWIQISESAVCCNSSLARRYLWTKFTAYEFRNSPSCWSHEWNTCSHKLQDAQRTVPTELPTIVI